MKRIMVAVASVLAACSGSNRNATSADVQALASVAQEMSAAVVSYRASAAAMTDANTCQAAQSAYDAQMGPMLDRMKQMSGALDDRMTSMGHPADADLACASNAMAVELDRHRAGACAATTDVASHQAEAAEHADAMDDMIAHQSGRATELGSAMGMSGMMDGGMMGADGGWVLPDGGMIGACYGASDGGYMMDGGMR